MNSIAAEDEKGQAFSRSEPAGPFFVSFRGYPTRKIFGGSVSGYYNSKYCSPSKRKPIFILSTMSNQDTVVANPEADVVTKRKRQPPYGVILHNDEINTFEFVIETLRKVFGYELEKCFQLTQEAHEQGRSLVWAGTLEGAELKREQVISRGPDPVMKARGALPLRVTLEEMPQ